MMVTVACPSCGFSREIPAERIPCGRRQVTCPGCAAQFAFEKPADDQVEPPAPAAASPPAMAELPPEPLPPPRPPLHGLPSQRPSPARTGLSGIGELFDESLKIYGTRFMPLFPLYLLCLFAAVFPVGASVLPALLLGQKPGAVLALLVLAGVLCGGLLGTWVFASFLHALLDEALPFGEAIRKGKSTLWSFSWVSVLSCLTITGGYLLAVVPGVIFTVWFAFASFVLVREKVTGTDALLKSREYVRGFGWGVALRLLLVTLVGGVVGVVPLAGPILSLLYFPYMMIFMSLLYRDLRRDKGDVPYSCGTMDRLRWPAVGLAGFVVVPVLLVSIGGMALLRNPQVLEGLREFKELKAALPVSAELPVKSDGAYRVITFPPKGDAVPASATATGTFPGEARAPEAAAVSGSAVSASAKPDPRSFHVFVYSVNYVATVRINGKTFKSIPGQPNMQYNYNGMGEGVVVGANTIEVEYNEVNGAQVTMPPSMQIKISRTTPGSKGTVLAEWRVDERGSGRKSFDLEVSQ